MASRRKRGMAHALGVSLLLAATAAQALPDKTYIIDLAPSRLDRALAQLARQVDISVDFAGFDLAKIKQKAVLGLFDREAALTAILSGSGYGFRKLEPGAYQIIIAPVRPLTKARPQDPYRPAREDVDLYPDIIIVRATKRAGIARRLPLSLAVMDAAELERLQITDTNALALHTAGMSSTNLGPSRNKIFIRGISDGSFTGRQQATIGAYLDNIRLNYNEPDPFLQLEDVDHVEVLRGPQGTLYGAGSMGGLYRVVTNVPDLENYTAAINTGVSLTRNGGQNGRISATVNMPIVTDRLAFRVTGYFDHNAGYIDDIQLGLKNVNTTNVFGSRARFLWSMNEHWDITAGLNFQDVIANDTQYFLQSLGPYKRANLVREPHEDDYINPFADIKGAYHWGDIVSSTSLVHRTIGDEIDASLAVPRIAFLPVVASPFAVNRTIKMVTNESRLVSRPGGRLDWLIGAFVSQRHETFSSTLTIPGLAASLVGSAVNGDVAFKENRRERTNEIAFFGETTLSLPYRFDLTGGLRWFRSNERTRAIADGSLGTGPVMRAGQSKDNGFTPKAVLSYQLNDYNLLYIQTTQGYRPGGINLNSPDSVFFETDETDNGDGVDMTFEPDKLKMYEVGGKFTLADGNVQVDMSVFTFKWNDIQSDQILPDGFSFILNAGYVRSHGLELDVSATPLPGLIVNANIAVNDTNFVMANPLLGVSPNNQLPSIPPLAGGVSVEYSWSAGIGKDWNISADYTYTGRSHLTFSSIDNRKSQSANMVNLRLALELPEGLQATLYVRNVLNEKKNTFAFGNPFNFRQEQQHTPPVPQTIGFSIKKQF